MRANQLAVFMTSSGLIATCFVCLLIGGTGRAHGLDPIRWRLGLADGESKYHDLDKRLAQAQVIG